MAIKIQELADLNIGEIEEKLAEAKEELFNLKFQHATGQLDNYKAIREARRDVARLKTVLRQRELEGVEGQEEEGQEEEGQEEEGQEEEGQEEEGQEEV